MHRRDDHVCPMLGRLSASSNFVNRRFDRHCCRVSSWKTSRRRSEGNTCHLPMWARNPVGSFDRNQKSAARMLTIIPFLLLETSGHDTHEMSAFDRTHFESRPSSFGNVAKGG